MTEFLDNLIAVWPWQALVLTIVATIGILAKGADRLVAHAAAISFSWGVPRVLVGATVVSLGTTTPEAVVSVLSALQGRSEMALGNAVGSVICDTGLILGLACVIAPLPFNQVVVTRQGWFQFACGVLLVLACVPPTAPFAVFTTGGRLPQSAGWAFLLLLAFYIAWSVALATNTAEDQELPAGTSRFGLARSFLGLVIAIAVVVSASALLIAVAAETADRFNVPPAIVAATLVAFGTSLPELIIVVTASWKGHGELAVGNVIGADILNVLFVAGAAAAVTPNGLVADNAFFIVQFPAMLLLLLVFRVGIWTAREDTFRRPLGYVLLGTYVFATVISYAFSTYTLGGSG